MKPISSPLPVSIVVLTYNEEQNIAECLQSVRGWAGEIFIVDSGSTDRTLDIARQYTDKIFSHPFENYAQQRNWAQANLPLSYEWVFHIDADERVSPELSVSFHRFFNSRQKAQVNGAMFPRRTMFMGRWIRHGGHYPVYHVRLFRRAKGQCEERLYDQHFIVAPPVVRLHGDLIDILTAEIDTWSLRHIRWAAQEAREMTRSLDRQQESQVASRLRGTTIERRRWLRNSVFGRSPLFARAFAYFFYRYFLRFGFLDGIEGLIFHFLQGCWYRFYVDVKIWESNRNQSRDDMI